MIRSVLTLRTTPENAERILELYRDQEILKESMELTRSLGSDIAVATDGSGEVVVTALWPDEAGYQEWLDHPKRGRTAPELSQLISGAEIGVGRLYLIDHNVSRG
jgi:quinol monooxygenase YgiN